MNGGFWGIEAVQVTGDMADRMQQHAEAMAQLIAQVVMYVMPGGAVLAYGPIALKRPIGRRTEAGGALTGAHMAKERAYFVHQGTSPLPRRQPIEAFEGILLQQPSPHVAWRICNKSGCHPVSPLRGRSSSCKISPITASLGFCSKRWSSQQLARIHELIRVQHLFDAQHQLHLQWILVALQFIPA